MDKTTTHWAAEASPALEHHTDEPSVLAEAVPALVFMTDVDGWILQANRHFQQYTGLDDGALAGSMWPSVVHAHDRSQALATRSAATDEEGHAVELQVRLAQTGRPYEPFDCRAVLVYLDGSIDRWTFTGVQPLQTEPECPAPQCSDVCYRLASKHATAGMARVAPDGGFLAVNERLCRRLGYSRTPLLGSDVRHYSQAQGITTEAANAAVLLQGCVDQCRTERHWLHTDGSAIEVTLLVSRLPSKDRAPERLVYVVADLSERKADAAARAEHGAMLAGFVEKTLFLDVSERLVPLGLFKPLNYDERGLLGLAFHPDFARNGRVYTFNSEPPSGHRADFTRSRVSRAPLSPGEVGEHSVIQEWRVLRPGSGDGTVDVNSARVLIRIAKPQFNHNGGMLAFGPDRLLYISLGDGGNADDGGPGHVPGGTAQSLAWVNVLGKIQHIDPLGRNSANGKYGIPVTNPFIRRLGADDIWARGFRNPYRMSFDWATSWLPVGDVGQDQRTPSWPTRRDCGHAHGLRNADRRHGRRALGRAEAARALPHPSVLLLDKATSHVGLVNEQAVSAAIRATQVTRIVVAHRSAAIRSADRVIDLDQFQGLMACGAPQRPMEVGSSARTQREPASTHRICYRYGHPSKTAATAGP